MSEQQTTTTPPATTEKDERDDWDYPAGHILRARIRAGNAYRDWRGFLDDVVLVEFEQTDFYRGMNAAAAPIELRLQEVGGPVGEAAKQLSDYSIHLYVEALRFGAHHGYALARTMPQGLEEFDSWLTRAKRFAAYPDGDPSDLHGCPKMPEAWGGPPRPISGGSGEWLDQERA